MTTTTATKPTVNFNRLPDLPASGIEAVDKAHGEYSDLLRRHSEAAARWRALAGGKAAALNRDRADGAAAVRADKADPGPVHVQRWEADLAAAIRDVDVLATAVAAAGEDLEHVFARHRRELVEQWTTARDKARPKVAKLADQLHAALVDVAVADAGLRLVEKWPNSRSVKPRHSIDVGLHGNSVRLDRLVADVKLFGAPPDEQPTLEWVELDEAVRLAGMQHRHDRDNFRELVAAGKIARKDEQRGPRLASGDISIVHTYSSADCLKVAQERREAGQRQLLEQHEAKVARREERLAALIKSSPAT